MKRFHLDAEQTDAILELKIYRLARLEILIIRNELEEAQARQADRHAAQGRGQPLEAGPLGAGGGPAAVRATGKADQRRSLIASDSEEPEYHSPTTSSSRKRTSSSCRATGG